MGRKFIIEEVEEESKFGCGSYRSDDNYCSCHRTVRRIQIMQGRQKTESRREPDGTTATFGRSKSPITVLCPEKFASECFRIDFNHHSRAAERSLSRTHNGNILR